MADTPCEGRRAARPRSTAQEQPTQADACRGPPTEGSPPHTHRPPTHGVAHPQSGHTHDSQPAHRTHPVGGWHTPTGKPHRAAPPTERAHTQRAVTPTERAHPRQSTHPQDPPRGWVGTPTDTHWRVNRRTLCADHTMWGRLCRGGKEHPAAGGEPAGCVVGPRLWRVGDTRGSAAPMTRCRVVESRRPESDQGVPAACSRILVRPSSTAQ